MWSRFQWELQQEQSLYSAVNSMDSIQSLKWYLRHHLYSTSSVGDTFKLTFTVSGNGGVQPRVSFNTNSPFRQLGFLADSTKTFASNVLISSA